MRKFAALAAVALFWIAPAWAQPARLILEPTPENVAALLDGTINPADVDFGSWRFGAEAGQLAFRQLAEGLRAGVQNDQALARAARGLKADARVPGCLAPKWLALQAWSAVAARAPDAGVYHDRRNLLAKELVAFQRRRAAAVGGAVGELSALKRWSDARAAAPTPVLAELFARVAAAQFNRLAPQPAGVLADAAADWAGLRTVEVCAIDVDNTAWLMRELALSGWFERDLDGGEADAAARLLVQAGDHEPTWQMRQLVDLEVLAARKKSDPDGVAQLADRLEANAARPQRYGTLGRCADGVWTPSAIADPANLDVRRALIGLGAFAQAAAAASAKCPQPPAVNAPAAPAAAAAPPAPSASSPDGAG